MRPPVALGPLPAVAAALWLVLMPVHAPAATTHATVTQLALRLSGHKKPHTRAEMLRGPTAADCKCNAARLVPTHGPVTAPGTMAASHRPDAPFESPPRSDP